MSPPKKGVAWYIPPGLRHWLNSHAEYLSVIRREEISTNSMVVEWLTDRIKIEESKRDQTALAEAIKEELLNSAHENRQGPIRSSTSQNAGDSPAKNVRNRGRQKDSAQGEA